MKNKYIFSLFLSTFITFNLLSQANAIIGTRLTVQGTSRSKNYYSGAEIRSSLRIGLEYRLKTQPVFVTISRDIYLSPNTEKIQANFRAIESRVITDYVGLGANFGKSFTSLGFMRKSIDSWATYNVPDLVHNVQIGLEIGIGYRSDRVSISYHPFLMIKPEFDPLSGFLRNGSINICYHLKQQKLPDGDNKSVVFIFKVGVRSVFPRTTLNPYESLRKIGLAPSVSFSVAPPSKIISLNFSRDIYASLNGGSPARDINYFINNSVLSLTYEPRIKNTINSIGLGYAFISDHATLYTDRAGVKSPKYYYYNLRGVSFALGKNFGKFEIQVRQIIPFNDRKSIVNRFSIGVFREIGK